MSQRPRACALAGALFLAGAASTARAADPGCLPDPSLSLAAAELLLREVAPSASQLTAAAKAAGSDAVGVRALFLPGAHADQEIETWLAELRGKSDAPLVCGDARTASARLIVASARGGSLTVEGGRARGQLARGFTRAELVVQSTDGQLTRLAAPNAALAEGIELPPELQIARIQLVATGSSGPRPIAERTLVQADPQAPSAAPPIVLRTERALDAAGVLQVIAQLRDERALPRLREHRMASELAQAHARAVCAQGRVAHSLEPGLDPALRLARAGLSARLVGETIGRAANLPAALQALWDSPSHQLTLLEPRFTHIGVGTAKGPEGKACLVALLLAWPRYQGK